mmetsp:Transcript_2934/g.5624  ORF Transcript_2934/g.5624 Transcript_2934/m.5624 type:complete len:114 (+) Transcript_2934:260-601(+)
MDRLRKSLSRRSLSRKSKLDEEEKDYAEVDSSDAKSRRSFSLRKTSTKKSSESIDFKESKKAKDISNRRKSMRLEFDDDSMSLDQKLRARARTSLRRSGGFNAVEYSREPVDW